MTGDMKKGQSEVIAEASRADLPFSKKCDVPD